VSKVKALHVLHSSLPNQSGYSVRAAHILRYLQEQGISVRAVTSAQQEPIAAAAVEVIEGVQTWRTPPVRVGQGVPGVRETMLMSALRRQLRRAAADFGPDLVHAHSPVLCGVPACCLARKLGVPLVYEVRDFWENASVDVGKFGQDSVRYRLARALDSGVMRRAQAVVVLSQAQRQEVLRRGVAPERLWIAENGVEPPGEVAPDPGLAARYGLAGKQVILYLGAFLPYEGLEVMVAAMAGIAAQAPEARLLVVGDGELRPALERQAAALGLDKVVHFAGRVPREQVNAHYLLAQLAVYPRIRTRTTELTTPLKPLEAMALGLAVLGSDLPAMREIIREGETGLLARPGEVGDLADKCLYALGHPERMAELAAAAREMALGERSWEVTLAAYPRLYRSLLGREE